MSYTACVTDNTCPSTRIWCGFFWSVPQLYDIAIYGGLDASSSDT